MTHAEQMRVPLEQSVEKGLKSGALGLVSTTVIATQTTILPTARTPLSMAAYKALPGSFAKTHPRYMTPTVSTIAMGGVSIALYTAMNYMSSGAFVIADAVIAIGLFIAFYYGLTGFACAWYYRKNLTSSARNPWMQGILPVAGGLMLYFLGGWSVWLDYNVATDNDYTMPDHQARVLQETDPDQGHAHPHAR
jgi:amino acid transporter